MRYSLNLSPKDLRVLLAALVTLAGGIWLDARAWPWAQAAVDVWVWAVLSWILWRTDGRERLLLVLCIVLATAGEYFLGFCWKLYAYRLGNLPLFVPPGHALVYAAGFRLRRLLPAFTPALLGAALAPACIVGVLRGYDTQAPLWFGLLICFLIFQRDRRFYATMFLFALAVESYGTGLGGWRYFAQERWFGLRTVTSPPLWTGVFYCTLDALVVAIAAWAPAAWRRLAQLRGAPYPEMGTAELNPAELSVVER